MSIKPPTTFNGALALLVLGAVLGTSIQAVLRTHRRRRAVSASLPLPLQTWEGEGGRPDPEPAPSDGGARSAPTV